MPSSKGRNKRHAHKNKRQDASHVPAYLARKVCDACGKKCYLTRDEAKRAAKVNHPGQVMHEYTCTEPSGLEWWHLSSIPAAKLRRLRDQRHYTEP